ncbi:MAG: gamma-glutamylcyclotransferase [Rubrimonas sp.]|uniref:gamma-glutamylcyclotransferase n=1 Tax=Rubrimonas sp. TaxID=2036015 RepID=UPI002FDE3617
MRDPRNGFWVFGYGSLIWRPGFEALRAERARLPGWRRSFCLKSIRYRGTPEAPGLVLGLDSDPDCACEGVAYQVGAETAEATLAYLRARELVTYAYREEVAPAALVSGETVDALIYVVDRAHPQYAGALPLAEQAAIIARSVGPMGPNRDYLRETARSLAEWGLSDPEIARLDALVHALTG